MAAGSGAASHVVAAAGGTISRIAPVLAEGAGVVTTRAHVRTVVTEYGVAQLFGRSVRERAKALIEIAHPDFRADLAAEARRRYHV
jgi:acyl-CoA hydrolase